MCAKKPIPQKSGLKILLLSSPNPNKTAGIIANSLYTELKKSHTVKILVNEWDNYSDKNIIPIRSNLQQRFNLLTKKVFFRLKKIGVLGRLKYNFNYQYSVQDYDQTKTIYSTKKMLRKVKFEPDIIIVLFMQNFLSFKNLFEMNNNFGAKIYLYLMDMSPFTGICHYSWTCDNYKFSCGRCPALASDTLEDQSWINYKFKKDLAQRMNIEVLACSSYTESQVRQSEIFKRKEIKLIHLPIEIFPFVEFGMKESRARLNLPNNKKVIFFGANSILNERKGFAYLMKSLVFLSSVLSANERDNIHLAIAGNSHEEIPDEVKIGYSYLGFLDHEMLKVAFAAADCFISPSIDDSGPMMVNQSLVRGTPVISFEMGVALDLIVPYRNGYLAKLGDAMDMAKCILDFINLNTNQLEQMRNECKRTAREFCTIQGQVAKITNLF